MAPTDTPPTRADYRWFLTIPTRWMDNDVYGHVNNVVYYSYFDTVVNKMLIAEGLLDIEHSPVIGLCVESHCNFSAPLVFPETVEAGLRIGRIGTSSVRYEIGLFQENVAAPAATGHFVHVFVDRVSRRPTPLDVRARAILGRLTIA
jgi:acyl-CoA thioester hydrolase